MKSIDRKPVVGDKVKIVSVPQGHKEAHQEELNKTIGNIGVVKHIFPFVPYWLGGDFFYESENLIIIED